MLVSEFDQSVNYGRYRVLQMIAFLRNVFLKNVSPESEIDSFATNLTATERATFDDMRKQLVAERAKGAGDVIAFFRSEG